MQGDLAGTSDWPEAGFPGIRINPVTLLPEIVNEDACDAALAASTDPADRIFVLIVEGHASEAAELLAEARFKDPESSGCAPLKPRSCGSPTALTARWTCSVSCWRSSREPPARPWSSVPRAGPTTRPGHIAAAVEAFARALDLRVAQSADAALIYSSTVALQRARDVLELAC